MNKKQRINTLQNLTILVLLASAVFLISRLPMFRISWAPRMQQLLTPSATGTDYNAPADLDSVMAAVHLAVMGNAEYGRHTQYSAEVGGDSVSQIRPLFREAMGSAESLGTAGDELLQQALLTPSLCLDLTRELPIAAAAFWLGENVEISGSVRSMALTTEEDTAALYLWDSRGLINHFSTALPSSAVEELALTFAPNGGSFGFESGFDGLAPYTILVSEPASVRAAWSALPDGYSAYNLLAALEFNPHTNSRYFESSGTEVVEVPSGSVRISQDGTTHYSGEPENASALFRPAIAGQQATAVEALDAARKLAAALSAGTNASPLYLADMSGSAGSWRITFRYQVDGIPVLMSSGEDALTVSMEGNAITAFAYYCRTYTGAEETATLLPPTMAAAIAAQKGGSGLSLCYVDSGAEVSARWVAQ